MPQLIGQSHSWRPGRTRGGSRPAGRSGATSGRAPASPSTRSRIALFARRGASPIDRSGGHTLRCCLARSKSRSCCWFATHRRIEQCNAADVCATFVRKVGRESKLVLVFAIVPKLTTSFYGLGGGAADRFCLFDQKDKVYLNSALGEARLLCAAKQRHRNSPAPRRHRRWGCRLLRCACRERRLGLLAPPVVRNPGIPPALPNGVARPRCQGMQAPVLRLCSGLPKG